MNLRQIEPNPQPETIPTPDPAPVEEHLDESIRTILLPLATGSGPLTRADLLAALDAACPTLKRSRKMATTKCRRAEDKTPIPSLTITGKCLERAGFRFSKKVTVRIGRDFVLVTVDKPGPDPEVDAECERVKDNRQQMQDIYDK